MKKSAIAFLLVIGLCAACLLVMQGRDVNASEKGNTSAPAGGLTYVHHKSHVVSNGGAIARDSEVWIKLPDAIRVEDSSRIMVMKGASWRSYSKKDKKEKHGKTTRGMRMTADAFTPDGSERIFRGQHGSVSRHDSTEVGSDGRQHAVVYLNLEHFHARRDGTGRELGPIHEKLIVSKDTGYIEYREDKLYDLKSGRLLRTITTKYDYPKNLPDSLFEMGTPAVK